MAGKVVSFCIAQGKRIEKLSLAELKGFSSKIDNNIYNYLALESVVGRRRALGGTAKSNVVRRLKELRV